MPCLRSNAIARRTPSAASAPATYFPRRKEVARDDCMKSLTRGARARAIMLFYQVCRNMRTPFIVPNLGRLYPARQCGGVPHHRRDGQDYKTV